jgi:hypothetical protein
MAILISKSGYKLKAIIFASILLLITPFLNDLLFQDNDPDLPKVATNVINAATSTNYLSHLPLKFIANKGQIDSDTKYHVEGIGHTILFCKQ